ncbi:hypothetical protein MRY87_03600 [bacterium]|nr:hypothetical protein [bacterium]
MICLSLVLLFRLLVVAFHPPATDAVSDALRHWINAQDTLGLTPTANWDPPLYQIYLAVIQKLSGGLPALVTWFAALLSAGMVLSWGYALSRLLPLPTALYGASVFGLIPEWVGLYSFHLNETLFLVLLGCSLGASFECVQRKTLRSFVFAFFLWLGTALTRGIGLPLMIVSVLWMAAHLPRRQWMLGSLLVCALSAPLLVPLTVRGYNSYRVLHPFGSSRGNEIMARTGALTQKLILVRDGAEWIFFFDSARGSPHPLAPLSQYETIREGQVEAIIDLSNRQYKEWVNRPFADPIQALTLLGDDTLFTLFGVPWPYVSDGPSYAQLGWYSRWLWGLLFCLLPWILWTRKPLFPEERLLLWLILTWMTVQLGGLFVPGQSRYRLPFEVLSLVTLCSVMLRQRSVTTTLARSDSEPATDTQDTPDPGEDDVPQSTREGNKQ